MGTGTSPLLAVLGTGLIGAPVARNLRKRGFQVRAWNRTAAKAQALVADGVEAAGSPAEAVRDASIIVTVLKDGPSVQQAMQAAAPALRQGAIWLQLSTVGIEGTNNLAALAGQLGLVFYDAPIQGSRQPAETAQLVILASGPVAQRDAVQPVFDVIGKRTLWVSEQAGMGSRLKLALNYGVSSEPWPPDTATRTWQRPISPMSHRPKQSPNERCWQIRLPTYGIKPCVTCTKGLVRARFFDHGLPPRRAAARFTRRGTPCAPRRWPAGWHPCRPAPPGRFPARSPGRPAARPCWRSARPGIPSRPARGWRE